MAGTEHPPQLTSTTRLRSRAWLAPTILSFAIAILFLAFLLTQFDIDVSDTWNRARGSDPWLLVLAFLVYYLAFPLRGYRWRLLLRNAKTFGANSIPEPTIPQATEMILSSWFVNSVAWFRLGDAYRAYQLSNRWLISFSRSIGTIAAERVLDVTVVFALLLVAGIGLLRGDTAETAGNVLVGAGALAMVVGLALLTMRLYGRRIARFLPQRLNRAYSVFQEGTLGSFHQLPRLAVLTTAIWLLEASRLYFVLQALDLDINIAMVLFVALAHSLLTAIPITPGGLGFVEAGLTGFLALSLSRADAAGVTLVDRSITYFSILIVGGTLFALRQALTLKRTSSKDHTDKHRSRANR